MLLIGQRVVPRVIPKQLGGALGTLSRPTLVHRRPQLVPHSVGTASVQRHGFHASSVSMNLWDKAKKMVSGAPKQPTEEELETWDSAKLYNMGVAYFMGAKEMSITPDPKFAIHLWKKSRAKGYPSAAYSLAMMQLENNPAQKYLEDETLDPLPTILQLAENGFTQAMFSVGVYHMYGLHGVTKNLDKAVKYFTKASEKGDIQSPYNLYLIFLEQGNHKDALKWLQHASHIGDVSATYFLANWYNVGGPYLEKDEKRAFQLHKEAADKGHPPSCHNVAVAYLSGKGCEADPELALLYTRAASDKGFLPSKMNLARYYIEGIVIKQDLETAKVLYREVLQSKAEGTESVREEAQRALDDLIARQG